MTILSMYRTAPFNNNLDVIVVHYLASPLDLHGIYFLRLWGWLQLRARLELRVTTPSEASTTRSSVPFCELWAGGR